MTPTPLQRAQRGVMDKKHACASATTGKLYCAFSVSLSFGVLHATGVGLQQMRRLTVCTCPLGLLSDHLASYPARRCTVAHYWAGSQATATNRRRSHGVVDWYLKSLDPLGWYPGRLSPAPDSAASGFPFCQGRATTPLVAKQPALLQKYASHVLARATNGAGWLAGWR